MIERIPCGYVECLDGSNSVIIAAINLKFKGNVVEDISITINVSDSDQLISKLEVSKIIIWWLQDHISQVVDSIKIIFK